jgi:hypothetical protein
MRVNLSKPNTHLLYWYFLKSDQNNSDWITYYQQQGLDIRRNLDLDASSCYSICEKHLPFLLLKYGDLIVES